MGLCDDLFFSNRVTQHDNVNVIGRQSAGWGVIQARRSIEMGGSFVHWKTLSTPCYNVYEVTLVERFVLCTMTVSLSHVLHNKIVALHSEMFLMMSAPSSFCICLSALFTRERKHSVNTEALHQQGGSDNIETLYKWTRRLRETETFSINKTTLRIFILQHSSQHGGSRASLSVWYYCVAYAASGCSLYTKNRPTSTL